MNLLKSYINGFLKRAGSYVFATTIASRLLSFLASWIVLQFTDNKELGIVLYAWNIIAFIMPFTGLGLAQSLLRYSALLNDSSDKKSLLYYVLKNGTFASIFLSISVSIIALIYPFPHPKTGYLISFLSLSFIPMFLLETLKIELRLQHRNKDFAIIDIAFNIILVLLVSTLSYFYKENGYTSALVVTPTLTIILFLHKINLDFSNVKKLKTTNIEFWKYGIFGGLSNVTTMLLFAIDILLIGNIMQGSENVTAFRYVSLLPYSLLFLPRVFINTDFVTFTENIYNKSYIYKYIKSYMLLFTIVSFCSVIFCLFFADYILGFFDKDFIHHQESFVILSIGICGILIFRGLFGNLLSAIGLVKINYYITLIALIINYFSNQYLIEKMGIKGAAITSASLMWITGILSGLCFFYFYKNSKPQK